MSQITFSHQFPHRWLTAPKLVKEAIVQELDDIVRLLDKETDLEEFEFSTPDLRGYIDYVYAELSNNKDDTNHIKQDAVKTVEEEQINDIHDEPNENSNDSSLTDLSAQGIATHIHTDSIAPSNQHTNDTEIVVVPTTMTSQTQSNTANANISRDSVNHSSANHSSANDGSLDEAFLHELEVRIDDYLAEQLSEMSENLKAWLREEVKQHINSQ